MTFRGATATDTSRPWRPRARKWRLRRGSFMSRAASPAFAACAPARVSTISLPRIGRLTSANELKRIASLAVPPAYKDVWICVSPRGHLQATGHDARGRKQYRYHPHWRQVRDSAKFDRMVAFGDALPKLRRKLTRDLSLPGLPREKVLAAVVALLDATRARIGNAGICARQQELRADDTAQPSRHFRARWPCGPQFPRQRGRPTRNSHRRQAHRAHRSTLPGTPRSASVPIRRRRWQPLSGRFRQVNDYLREAMGDDFTAKDFRTWGATLRALVLLARIPRDPEASETAIEERDRRRRQASRLGAAQHARRMPQVLHQPGRVRRMALGSDPHEIQRQPDNGFSPKSGNVGTGLSSSIPNPLMCAGARSNPEAICVAAGSDQCWPSGRTPGRPSYRGILFGSRGNQRAC